MIDDQATAAAAPSADAARAPSAASTFGAVLAAERERQGISIGDMAGRLRLHPKQLVAIEAEDFSALPTAPFLRGFVRNYAKELRIDSTPLLAELSERLAPKSVEASESGNASGPRGPGGDRLPRALVVTVAVGALVVFGAIGVMSSRDTSRPPTEGKAAPVPVAPAPAPPAAGASAPAVAETNSTAPSSPVTEVPAPSTDITATAPGAAAGAAPAQSKPGPAAEPKSSPAAGAGAGRASAAPGTATGTAALPPASSAAGAPGTPAAPASVAPSPASKSGAIVRSVRLSFNDAAWVRIEDAEGKVLLSQVNEAGTEQRVAGKTPLRLIIGNASNVTLDVSGREIDLKPRTSPDNVARVTVE